jgi:hypothetical protein
VGLQSDKDQLVRLLHEKHEESLRYYEQAQQGAADVIDAERRLATMADEVAALNAVSLTFIAVIRAPRQ